MADGKVTPDRAAMIKAVVSLARRLRLSPNQTVIDAVRVRARLQDEIDAGAVILIERTNGDRVQVFLGEPDEKVLFIAALESEMGIAEYLDQIESWMRGQS